MMHPRASGGARSRAACGRCAAMTPPIAVEAESGGGPDLAVADDRAPGPRGAAGPFVGRRARRRPDSPMRPRMAGWLDARGAGAMGRLLRAAGAAAQAGGERARRGIPGVSRDSSRSPPPRSGSSVSCGRRSTPPPSSPIGSARSASRRSCWPAARTRSCRAPPRSKVAERIPGARFEVDPESGHTVRASFRGYDEIVEAFLAEGDPRDRRRRAAGTLEAAGAPLRGRSACRGAVAQRIGGGAGLGARVAPRRPRPAVADHRRPAGLCGRSAAARCLGRRRRRVAPSAPRCRSGADRDRQPRVRAGLEQPRRRRSPSGSPRASASPASTPSP